VFLWHFPAGFPGSVTPTTLPCGVRTFLEGPVVSPTSPRLLGRQPVNSRGAAALRRRLGANPR